MRKMRKMRKALTLISFLFALGAFSLRGQNKSEAEIKQYCCNPSNLKILGDSSRSWRFTEVRPTEKFDIVFNKSFEIFSPTIDTGGGRFESLPINNIGSGANFIGLSFNWILAKRSALKIKPGIAFYSIVFNKSFNIAETQEFIKEDILRIKFSSQYLEMPVGLGYALYRDDKKKLISYLELGLSLGIKLGSGINIAFSKINNIPQPELRVGGIPEINPFRAGVYAQAVYRIFGIWAFYKFTDYFQESRGGFKLPDLGRLELGFSFAL
jgi:hypothetical protein